MLSLSKLQAKSMSVDEIREEFLTEIWFLNNLTRRAEYDAYKNGSDSSLLDEYSAQRKNLIMKLEEIVKPISVELFVDLCSRFD